MDKRQIEIADLIVMAIEECWGKNIPITLRNIFLLLDIPLEYVEPLFDLEQKIPIHQESDIVIMKAMISSKIALMS